MSTTIAKPIGKRTDFSTMYISRVDEAGEPGETYGYNVQIKRIKFPSSERICDFCGTKQAEYVQDATEDLGTGSCNQDACQDCMTWSFNNQSTTGDLFQEKP